MGGEGSGRWNDHEKRRTAENSWALEIAAMSLRGSLSYPLTGTVRAIKITGNRNVLPVRYSLVEDEEGPVLDITYTRRQRPLEIFLEPEYTERVGLLATEPARGGVRWWFACPVTSKGERCKRRVGKLYFSPGEHGFGCRQCHNLTYESSQESHATDRLAALFAGGRSGEEYEVLKVHFAHLEKAKRWQRKKNATSPGLMDIFDEMFGTGEGP